MANNNLPKDHHRLTGSFLKRLIIIFSVFIALAIIAIAFIYLYQSQINLALARYTSKITICENILNENDCFSQYYCEPIYTTACADCQDLVFKSCHRLSDEDLVDLERQKAVCENSGGQWYRNHLGNFCLCQSAGANKIFDKILGCVNH